MTINAPTREQIPQLRQLWQQAFGDTEAFLDSFFSVAFSPERSRCVSLDGKAAAALYWFDCTCRGQKMAYLYAVATDAAFQNQGLCRALMTDTHSHLRSLGYRGAILVPGSRQLFSLYEKLGYRTCSHIWIFSCTAGAEPVAVRSIGQEEYAALRRQFLPVGGVVQEGAALALLEAQSGFYAGDGVLLAATLEDHELICSELLGDAAAAAGILAALGATEGQFRAPGGETPFAMFLPLVKNVQPPTYFGLALD